MYKWIAYQIKFYLLFHSFLCASGIEFCCVKISYKANSPNKLARHAAWVHMHAVGKNVYTYLYMTAANEVACLPTKFTLHYRKLFNSGPTTI